VRFERRSSELTGRRTNKDNTGEAFRKRLSGAVCKLPYAAWGGNSPGGER